VIRLAPVKVLAEDESLWIRVIFNYSAGLASDTVIGWIDAAKIAQQNITSNRLTMDEWSPGGAIKEADKLTHDIAFPAGGWTMIWTLHSMFASEDLNATGDGIPTLCHLVVDATNYIRLYYNLGNGQFYMRVNKTGDSDSYTLSGAKEVFMREPIRIALTDDGTDVRYSLGLGDGVTHKTGSGTSLAGLHGATVAMHYAQIVGADDLNQFPGVVSDHRMFNTALTEAQIEQEFDNLNGQPQGRRLRRRLASWRGRLSS
jgi:hypothetical protein